MNQQPVRPPAFISAPPRRVVFLCIHNSARSQMAEGFARALAPAEVEIWSAGSEPSRVHPAAIEVMRERDIDISKQTSKGMDDVPWRDADTVVTLCGEAEEVCPVLAPSVRQVHWALPDPAKAPDDKRTEVFREVRDDIRWRVASLWPRG